MSDATPAPVQPEELTPQQAVMLIAANELAHKGALSPDTVELIVLFSPRPIEVHTADVAANTATVTISTWFSGKVFNGQWTIRGVSQRPNIRRTIEETSAEGSFKIAQTLKDYLKALAGKANLMKSPGGSIITLN